MTDVHKYVKVDGTIKTYDYDNVQVNVALPTKIHQLLKERAALEERPMKHIIKRAVIAELRGPALWHERNTSNNDGA